MSVKVREQRGEAVPRHISGRVRKWESLHITLSDDKKQNKELYRLAEICRSKREAQLLTGEWDIKTDGARRITLAAYIRNYAKTTNTKPMTSLLHHIEKYANGATIQIGQVTSKWIEDFQQSLLHGTKADGKTLSQSSAGAYMKLLRAVFRKAAAEGTISRDPMVAVSLAKVIDPEMVFLGADELRRLAAEIPESEFGKEVRRAFLFGCFMGLRVSEIETLTWGMIERAPPQIIKRQKKTRNSVYIPLNKSAAALIFDGAEHLPDDFVFSIRGENRPREYRALRDWAESAGITKKIGWHTARRGCRDGRPPPRYTGLGQVMKYVKTTDEMKRRAVEALPEVL